ncbi:MFS transporter [Geobacter sp. FeAm09]|uniref:MFS transporter n=1 Tax=Geobacter sp. FeAm09 TaxID=2597769 RepID=UPI0011ECC9EF|nr:MFS transporter [Geobacter sp. FeAm09]QEM68148.1 MFS transporter [Geobacter sp. FeAm09]
MTGTPPSTGAGRERQNTRWLLLLCLCQLFIMLVFINYSAILPILRQEWGMSNTRAGMIFSVYQVGYIASGVILSTLTDRMNTKLIFIGAALWSAAANLLFARYAHDFASGMVLRALTGIGMGGTYMPGLKLVAERFAPARRGRAIGIYVGSLMLGSSLSLAVTGWLSGLYGWRAAFTCCSVGVFAGALLAVPLFRGYHPAPRAQITGGYTAEVARNRPAILMILGYGSHMWEMYGMRSWLAPFFTAALVGWGYGQGRATALASTIAALLVGIGAFSTAVTGTLSDRFGRTATIAMVMLASALLSFSFGWLINTNIWLTSAIGLLYGYLVVAESPVFSTGLTELVAPGYLGAAMGLQSLIGYSLASISPTVFGWTLDTFRGWQPFPGITGAWGLAFASLGIGGLAGPFFMWWLRRSPESLKMANGRR